jgi:hypothetical protein
MDVTPAGTTQLAPAVFVNIASPEPKVPESVLLAAENIGHPYGV